MRSLIPALLLCAAVLGCSKLTGDFDRHGIKEVSLILDSKRPNGKYYAEYTYSNTGKVLRKVHEVQPDGTVSENSERIGRTTKASFQKIEDAVIAADFFKQPNLGPGGSTKVIRVKTSTETIEVDLERTGDPRVQAIGLAISGSSISWDGPPKTLP